MRLTLLSAAALAAVLVFDNTILRAGAGGNSEDASSETVVDKNPYTVDDAEAIAEGKALWSSTGCYACHGGKAEGGVGPSLTDDEWVYKPTDKALYKAIAQGRPGTNMVGWSKDLNNDQIWQLIAFIRSLYEGDPAKIIW